MQRQMNSQPIKISIRVDKDIKIGQIIKQIATIPEINIDLEAKNTNIFLYVQSKGVIKGIFNPEFRLSQYNFQGDEIEAIELLN